MSLSNCSHFVLEKSVVLEVVFYKNQGELISSLSSKGSLIVCPSPLIADGLRRQLPKGAEVITISKWVSDALKNKNLTRSNKAELMLRLSSVWRHYFPKEEAHLFFKSFELFTELRSFTLDLNLLSEFMKELDEVIVKSILIFWTFLDNENIIDEHKSYHCVSDVVLEKDLYIVGFKHLSGIQIDMLKTLGEQINVFVPFPEEVYAETFSSDWIRWIMPEQAVEKVVEKKSLKFISFPKNKLNTSLDAVKKVFNDFDLALASSNLTFHARQEVLRPDQFFKSPEDLFQSSRENLLEELKVIAGDRIEISELNNKVEELKKASLASENFILYKVILLLEEAVKAYSEFQSHVDPFSLVVFDMILALNSPRVSMAPLLLNQNFRLLELNEIGLEEIKRPLVVIASSSYGTLKTSDTKYSEKMIEALRLIAPLKRAGLDFIYLKHEVTTALSQSQCVLFMEEGLELVDLGWREILKSFDLEKIQLQPEYKLKSKKDYLSNLIKHGPHPLKHVSASRLQTYFDCPRKYYFSYIEKLDHRPDERLKIAHDEMGSIEHKIIEKYFTENSFQEIYNKEKHEDLCRKELESFLELNSIRLNEKSKMVSYYELVHYTQNGITYLLEFAQMHNAKRIEFESSVGSNPLNLVGFIDCLVHLEENKIALFDFKRSKTAIGSKDETLSYDKIQIWAYLLVLNKYQGKVIHSWGYLNLSEIDESLVFHEEVKPILGENILGAFEELFLKGIEGLQKETHFLPMPRQEKICNFCEVQLYCNRGCQ
jgi:CRISPR/Cas system-associated exonuclease Cas4 (RecB family)